MGKFDVDMAMYEGPNYSPHEKLQERGGVYLNDRIYIQLEMYDPLQRNEIVLSVQDRLRLFRPPLIISLAETRDLRTTWVHGPNRTTLF